MSTLKTVAACFCLAILFALGSCKKQETLSLLRVKVLSTTNEPMVGVALELLPPSEYGVMIWGEGVIQQVTGEDGIVEFTFDPKKDYQLFLMGSCAYGTLSGNEGATFFETGTFRSEEEIDNSPGQTPPAQIGGVKYADINGDAIVDDHDLIIPLSSVKTAELTIRIEPYNLNCI
ncbi:hypothetical protein [Parapedobacter koreensis]|uniref:Uncharacterized protein n=1 Tax=Parapedobacter koreensis TaxID=332977 RepID=A0A1H7UBK3_9SPHI|nr:hypothetical protein [Parapedobacter koreensis]SEL94189.1 hypothetical protein SAMN05421740_11473 [Parapedobacter koreensis]